MGVMSTSPSAHFDVAIVGSGFGGSVSALRLTEKGYRVAVFEAGRRFDSDDYARTSWNLRRFLWLPALGLRGIQRIDLLPEALVLSGAGVGGGSLVYANTLLEPHDAFFTDSQWGSITDWKSELRPFYARARRMLGATAAPADTPSDRVMRQVAAHFGASDDLAPTTVGVFLGAPGERVPDPYFGGIGPDRLGCTQCGGCMVGCRFDAKNTLDKNYLYLAEQAGARVVADTQVVDIQPTGDGYRITTRRPGAWLRRRRRVFDADQVVLSAGALGTTRLLLDLSDRGSLPHLSERIGHLVRTNSESILGAVARDRRVDYSQGVAITSSFHPVPDTRVEPVRYSPGSNAMGLLATILVEGEGRGPQWWRFGRAAIRHPIAFARSLSVRHWSERSIIVLVMQSIDNSIRLARRPGRVLRHRRRFVSRPGHGAPNPRWIPVGHTSARLAAQAIGGFPAGSINESLLTIPMTAHILGGAPIGRDPSTGVIDAYHRAFGHPGLHVVDGSAVSANLGSNPSLTITALAERAMSMWPNAGEADPRPPLGDGYQPVAEVPAKRRVIPPGAPVLDGP